MIKRVPPIDLVKWYAIRDLIFKYDFIKALEIAKNCKYPDAIFVIFDEQEENEIKATRASIKRKVIIESAKLPIDKKIEIIQILLGISTKGQSNDYIELKFDECIDKFGADKLLTIMQRDKSRNTTHSLVLEAIQKNVLRKEGSSIYYMDDQLGFDLEATMDYLEDKKNQLLRAAIIEKIN